MIISKNSVKSLDKAVCAELLGLALPVHRQLFVGWILNDSAQYCKRLWSCWSDEALLSWWFAPRGSELTWDKAVQGSLWLAAFLVCIIWCSES